MSILFKCSSSLSTPPHHISKVRFHYGHSGVFDRLFHLTRGVSKASRTTNLGEDIFAGYVTHHEYIQVGKGRDLGRNHITLFESKVANGNGEQAISHDMYILGSRLPFYRMMSCYSATIGFYSCSLLTVIVIYVMMCSRIYPMYGHSFTAADHISYTLSMWIMVVSWLFSPFIFNPSSLEWQKVVDDWHGWNDWMGNPGAWVYPLKKVGKHGGMKRIQFWNMWYRWH